MINADGGAYWTRGTYHWHIDVMLLQSCNEKLFQSEFFDGCMTPKVVPNKSGKNWLKGHMSPWFIQHTICTCHLPRKRQKNRWIWQKKLKNTCFYLSKLFFVNLSKSQNDHYGMKCWFRPNSHMSSSVFKNLMRITKSWEKRCLGHLPKWWIVFLWETIFQDNGWK